MTHADDLERSFDQPPENARPWVYWYFMDGNLSREGMTADLESMQQAGIGGVLFLEVNVGVPRGPVEFMSPAWRELLKHAVAEADRLGLEFALGAGPGWTGSGGPWVPAEQSMQHLVASETKASGPVAIRRRPTAASAPPAILRRRYADAGVAPRMAGILSGRRRAGVSNAQRGLSSCRH